MTTQGITITETWQDLKDLATLVDDKSYSFQNIGNKLIYFAESVVEPTNLDSARQILATQTYNFVAVGSLTQWVRTCEGQTSVASILEKIISVNTTINNGIPDTFTQQTSSSKTFLIQKGQLNHYRQRPMIVNEHVETAREVQAVVGATTIVGQIFKASQDNINGINVTLESAAGVDFDDFEDYADSAALQVNWNETDPGDPAELEEVIVAPGVSTKSMQLPGNATLNDEWWRTFAETDFTDWTGEFDFYATHANSFVKLRVFVEDSSGNISSAPLVQQEENSWEHLEIDINSLTADDVTPADLSIIVKIGFRLVDTMPTSFFYIDNMVSVPPPGSIQLELWDMGTTLPESDVTSLDDGAQYTDLGDLGLNGGTVSSSVMLNLIGGKRSYQVRSFSAGPALEVPGNVLLVPGNYYAIVFRYTDTDVSIYGADTDFASQKGVYYVNGYAFTTPDNATAINQIGPYNDIQFAVFSIQDVHVNTLLKFYDAVPGNNATESVYIEDENMKIVGIIANESTPQQTLLAEFDDRFFEAPKGGKMEVNHNDDFNDDTTQITVLFGYLYEPPIVNG